MPHDHGHGHGHCHHHAAPADPGRAFFIGIVLNSLFIAAELYWGFKSNSLALIADAWHNVSDVLALALSWGAVALGRRKPSARFTYGLGGSSIVASLANAVTLLIAIGAIAWESIQRLSSPEPTQGMVVMVVAGIGVIINGGTALLFMRGHKHDLNIKSAYLHMVADAAISLGVVISGAVILSTGWLWLDPLASLVIALIIVAGTWGLLKESLSLSLHGVPQGIDPAQVKAALAARAGVKEVHDLHIWAVSTTEVACSVHLVMPGGHPGDAWIKDTAHALEHDFRVSHTTIQIELGDSGTDCPLAPDDVV